MATSSSLRTLRTVGIVLVVIGAVAMVLGLAGYVSVTLHHAGIQCPGETRDPPSHHAKHDAKRGFRC